MTTKTTKERIAIMETKISNVETTVDRIETKLDNVIECKADKKEVEALRIEMITRDKEQDNQRNKLIDWLSNNWFQIIVALSLLVYGILRSRGLLQ